MICAYKYTYVNTCFDGIYKHMQLLAKVSHALRFVIAPENELLSENSKKQTVLDTGHDLHITSCLAMVVVSHSDVLSP